MDLPRANDMRRVRSGDQADGTRELARPFDTSVDVTEWSKRLAYDRLASNLHLLRIVETRELSQQQTARR
jgi:hypothetical protein